MLLIEMTFPMSNRFIKFQILFALGLLLATSVFATHKVYVIHGFGGSLIQMDKINQGLRKEGYLTENYTYPSFKEDLDSLGMYICRKISREHFDTISFVTHSMGGLLVRSLYQYKAKMPQFPFVFRIVMLAPPNKGSQLAEIPFGPVAKKVLGPNLDHMKTYPDAYVRKLPIPDAEVGIIAGARGKKPWYNPLLKEDNDGTVCLSSVYMGGEKEVVVVHAMHVTMPLRPSVVKLVLRFMKSGSFL
jgi:triacylglycerol lipase